MIKKLFPVILGILGLCGGLYGGLLVRPAPDAATEDHDPTLAQASDEGGHALTNPHKAPTATETEEHANAAEYVKLSNQFVIPVIEEGQVVSMVILALTLEVSAGSADAIYAREPKLRDAFLQVLFDHANSGGFKGSFTDGANLVILRRALREAAQTTLGPEVSDVLISDIARQDS